MKITGKIIEVLDVVSGENERGEWKRGGFVVEVFGDEPYNIKMELSNSYLDKFPVSVGQVVEVWFSVSSRKLEDKWFTNVRCYYVKQIS